MQLRLRKHTSVWDSSPNCSETVCSRQEIHWFAWTHVNIKHLPSNTKTPYALVRRIVSYHGQRHRDGVTDYLGRARTTYLRWWRRLTFTEGWNLGWLRDCPGCRF